MTTTGTGSFHLIINSTEFDNLFASPLVSITMKGTRSSGLRKNKKELFEELYKADNSNLRSLHHVSVACLPKPLRVLTTKAPRVFHIGDWSVLRQFLQLPSLRPNIVMIPSFSADCTTERGQIVKRPLRKPGKFWKKHGRHFSPKGDFYSIATVHTLLFDTFLSLCCFRLEVLRTRRRKVFKLEQGNGGWGDVRDHRLCLNISVHR